MKVIQVPYCFYPDASGGTEDYVKWLCKGLKESGIDCVVAAPTQGGDNSYFYEGIKVRRFNISKGPEDLSDLYGGSDPMATKAFAGILDDEKPDLVHLHALTYAVSIGLVREAKSRGIRVIFTYHTPAVSCQSGDLIRSGKRTCKGLLDPRTCAVCVLYGFNIPRGVADLFALIPFSSSHYVKKYPIPAKIITALRMRGFIECRIKLFKNFINEVDRIIVLCDWTRELLSQNNMSLNKVNLVRHGIYSGDADKNNQDIKNALPDEHILKIAYLGRIDRNKGIDIIIKALKSLPGEPIEIDIYGIVQDKTADKYLRELKNLARREKRITFLPSVPSDETIALLKKYHYLAIPSIYMETGPLVALEAFAAGIPVIGSSLGGIEEIVRDQHNGLLVRAGSLREWRNVFKQVSRNRQLLVKLRKGIKPPKTMRSVVEEIKPIYNSYRCH